MSGEGMVGGMRERIIVALDLPEADQAVVTAAGLEGRVSRVKVGLTLFSASGPAIVERLQARGLGVFLDLKFHDIPHQVAGACRRMVALGVDMFTVHASGGRAMLRSAVEATRDAAGESGVAKPSVLAVTVLTSMDTVGMRETGVDRPAEEQVLTLAALAASEEVDGVVCSPREADRVRGLLGEEALVVTPGVRPAWAQMDDQVRVSTPQEALEQGASHVVIGRPITAAPDPVEALERIIRGA